MVCHSDEYKLCVEACSIEIECSGVFERKEAFYIIPLLLHVHLPCIDFLSADIRSSVRRRPESHSDNPRSSEGLRTLVRIFRRSSRRVNVNSRCTVMRNERYSLRPTLQARHGSPVCFSSSIALPASGQFRVSDQFANACRQKRPVHRFSCSPSMSSVTAELKKRLASVRSAEKLIDAMRLVAAARIRESSRAALAARPFAERLQAQLSSLIKNIQDDGTDVAAVAAAARHDAFAVLSGPITIDNYAQRALMDRMYLTLLDTSRSYSDSLSAETSPFSSLSSFGSRSSDSSTTVTEESFSKATAADHNFNRPIHEDSTSTLLVIFTSDRGFCGSYNKDVLARAVQRIRTIERSHKERGVELVLIGKTACNFFARHFPHLPVRFETECGKPSSFSESVAKVCDAVLSEFIVGDLERVEVVYTRFTSLISNAPCIRTLLPLTPSGLEVEDDEIFQLTSKRGKLYVIPAHPYTSPNVAIAAGLERMWHATPPPRYYMSKEESILMLNAILPMYIHSQLSRMMRESVAAELACRMNAMQAATDNCRDIAQSLKSRYHRERQSRITTEVVMVAGFPRF